tara:strand:- start:467 stop:757 length:291 start_codon:yes stop_codon:yes gene_type:complete
MKKHILVSIAIIMLPAALILLGRSETEMFSNIGQLLEMLYLSPGLVAQEELFGFQKNIGLLPKNSGRLVVTAFYLLLYWGVVFALHKRSSSELHNS